jgi:hypothetical protein
MEHELFDVTVHSTGQYYNGAVARGVDCFCLTDKIHSRVGLVVFSISALIS